MAEKGAHVNVMRNFVDNLQLVLSQIREGESQRDEKDEFDRQAYWSHLGTIFTAISNEATKLSMAFSKPPAPPPEHSQLMITSLEKATLALVSAYYSFPKTQGVTLRKALKKAVLNIMESVKSLAQNIADYDLGSQEQMRATGIVWHGAEILSTLPKDNQRAALAILEETSELVRDALHELQEALDNEGQADDLDELLIADGFVMSNEDTWTDSDKEVLTACMGLIKTVKSLLKKSKESVKQNAVCDTEANIAQLDDLVDHLGNLSPATDNLAACLYPPMVYQSIMKHTDDLSACVEKYLQFLKHSHMTGEGDQQWLEFLLKANLHNRDKVHSLVHKS
ncbi:cyclin-D1-binding protein 1 homolog [Haliotis cracherodii]|uniref:cyclin-D1-binding protein 1 homolog n=1 Tax=Haliotis rufescens TaxID=6454 RepID=UPI001EAFB941|nr:cyclin-D1-binding protein 1 homolog [Haliotis rufescens]